MTGTIGKTTNRYKDTLRSHTQSERETIWGEIDGEIVDFDPATQTATVKPLYRPRHNGELIDMPELLEVPVNFPRAGGGSDTSPIKAGNKVRLRPKMRSSEEFHAEGKGEAGEWSRSFDLSDMEAFLDGGNSLTDPIKNFDTENRHIRFDEDGQYGIRGSADGKVKIDGKDGNIYDLIATAIELIAADSLQINYGSSAGSGHALENKAALTEIAGKLRSMAL